MRTGRGKGTPEGVDDAEALFERALQRQMSDRLPEAEMLYRELLAREPRHAVVHFNLGLVLRQLGRLDEAAASYGRALELQPEFPEAANNLGTTLVCLGRLDDAVEAFRLALSQRHEFANAWNNLGGALKDLGRAEEALGCFESAMRLQPANAAFHSNYVFALHYSPSHGPADLLREARLWNERHAGWLVGDTAVHRNDPEPSRRLRVGYVSAHFRDHCQALFLMPLLSHHDPSQVEVVCYSDAASEDAVTERLRAHAGAWRRTSALGDGQLADLVREDRIDVLVDLSLHMARQRLLALARRPAPVQVAWLGYPGTTGMDAVGWRLSDPWLDPPEAGDELPYSEMTYRLPDSFWCYDPMSEGPALGAPPALACGGVTFGCLNNFCKVNDGVLALWRRVLDAVPGSRMTVMAPRGEAWARVASALGRERVSLVEFAPRAEYLARYGGVDVCLDTFPYNGHTTSLDALWMGVPVVSLRRETVASRAGLSMLANLGLGELAVETEDDYVRVAAALAEEPLRLASLRSTLRGRMESSPLMDGPRFARAMERAYREFWHAWCRGAAAQAR